MRFEVTSGSDSAILFSDSLTVGDPDNGAILNGKQWIFGVEEIPTPFSDPVDTAGYSISASSIDSINCLAWEVRGSQNPTKICGGWVVPIDKNIFQSCYGKSQFCQATMVQTTGVAGQGTYSAGLTVLGKPSNATMLVYTFRILTDDKTWSLTRLGSATANLATGSAMTNGDVFRLSADLSVSGQVTLTVKRNGSVLTTYVDNSANRIVTGSPYLLMNYASKGAGTPKSEWRTFSCGVGL